MSKIISKKIRPTKSEYLQLIGLISLGRTKANELNSIKEAFTKLLKYPYLGDDEFWDMVYDSSNIQEMLDKSLKVRLQQEDPLRRKKSK